MANVLYRSLLDSRCSHAGPIEVNSVISNPNRQSINTELTAALQLKKDATETFFSSEAKKTTDNID